MIATVEAVVGLLAGRHYDVLESMTRGRRLSRTQLRLAAESRDGDLVPAPPQVIRDLKIVEVKGSSRPTYDVDVQLWNEEGPSELILQLRLTDEYDGAFEVETLGFKVIGDQVLEEHDR